MRGKQLRVLQKMCSYMLEYREFLNAHNIIYPHMDYIIMEKTDERLSAYVDSISFLEWETNYKSTNVAVLLPYQTMCNLIGGRIGMLPRTVKEYMKMITCPGGPFVMAKMLKSEYLMQAKDPVVKSWQSTHGEFVENPLPIQKIIIK